MIHTVIPVKPLHAAKSRLAHLLSSAERRALALAMLGDVLAALRGAPCIAGVTVVSRDPAALRLADERGAATLLDCASDLNGALAQAAAFLSGARDAAALLVVPADLPLLTAADVERLAEVLDAAPAVALAPSQDGGTNALLAAPPTALPFQFGPGSLARHLAAAHARGIAARIVRSPGLERDIDRAADLLALANMVGDTETQRLVRALGLAARAACA